MITRLEIENFKAIKHLVIDLDPLTVLVGPNDSGKSTILQALELLSRSLHRPIYSTETQSVFDGHPREYVGGGDRSKVIRLAIAGETSDSQAFSYDLQLGLGAKIGVLRESAVLGSLAYDVSPANGTIDLPGEKQISGWKGDWSVFFGLYRGETVFASLWKELSSFLVALEPKKLSVPCGPDVEFQSSGLGLAALVDRVLTDTDRSARDAYEDAIRSFSRHVAGVGTRPVKVTRADGPTTLKELIFGLRDKTQVPAREVSTGLLATAGYLGLLHLPARRFLIEEPENGLHPQALLQIVDVLRKLADEGRQVVMTTHSPVLLNYIDAANIRIVTRTADEGVKVTPAVESRVFNEVKQKVDFGALWYSLGDESLAVPR